ncbi:hypothetical protein [Lysobacter sp. CA196]|uniref:hypothetical protein n=1 Tax=Lysobacter sp. CA196 TaxID=3455606 RepID=UPI003F8CF274
MSIQIVGRNTAVPAAPSIEQAKPEPEASCTKVIHSTVFSGLGVGTQVTLIVHSETMSDQHVSLLHDNCLKALERAARSVCEQVAAA